MINEDIKRGDIYFADLSPAIGSEQDGIRPVLIIQNNKGNKYSPCVVSAITSKEKTYQPTHVQIGVEYGLSRESYVMLEQIRTVDKIRLKEYIGTLDDAKMQEINRTLAISFGLVDEYNQVQ